MKHFFLASVSVFLVLYGTSQIQPCIDVRAARESNTAGQGVYDFNNKWTPGTTLKVTFIGGTAWQQAKVKQYAPVWSSHANIKFEFPVTGAGDIRISFEKKGSYSYIGTDAKNRTIFQETMNLGWIEPTKSEAQLKAVILHEFGHALGLLHEHLNPLVNIRWNKPVVYAYYLQYEGWNREMVDRQVFDRYSVSMTNKSYDPKSIMHYPIPADFTLDGYSVGENFDLSESDKKLVAELYPRNRILPLQNRTTAWSKLQDLKIEYDVTENGQLGMRIKQDFLIYNAQGQKCIMAAYFYNADNNQPLKDKNGLRSSVDGNVATFTEFTPNYQNTQFNQLTVFMPYDELELSSGVYRLKCYVAIFDPALKMINSSGYQYFTYRKGISSKELRVQVSFNNGTRQIEITPSFTIEGAKNINCKAVAYFYNKNGTPLRDFNNLYNTKDGTVASTVDFNPGYDITVYNQLQQDFKIYLPYSELHLLKGTYDLQYRVVLFDDNWNPVVRSQLYKFNFTQY